MQHTNSAVSVRVSVLNSDDDLRLLTDTADKPYRRTNTLD